MHYNKLFRSDSKSSSEAYQPPRQHYVHEPIFGTVPSTALEIPGQWKPFTIICAISTSQHAPCTNSQVDLNWFHIRNTLKLTYYFITTPMFELTLEKACSHQPPWVGVCQSYLVEEDKHLIILFASRSSLLRCHLSLKIVNDDKSRLLGISNSISMGFDTGNNGCWWYIELLFALWTNGWECGPITPRQRGLLPLYEKLEKISRDSSTQTAIICSLSLLPKISTRLDPSWSIIHINTGTRSWSQFRTSSGRHLPSLPQLLCHPEEFVSWLQNLLGYVYFLLISFIWVNKWNPLSA